MNRFWKIAIGSQVLAIFTQLYLTSTHYKLKLGLMDGKSLCNISDLLNCDVVNTSAYSELFGVPLALWGVVANVFLLLAILNVALSDKKALWLRVSEVSSVFIALTSVVMGLISFIWIKSLCIFCVTAYLLSFVTLYCVRRLSKDEVAAPLKAVMGPLLVSGLAVAAVSWIGNKVILNSLAGDLDLAVSSSMSDWKTGKDVNLLSASGLIKGSKPESAKMVIVEFADFQCIHCKQSYLPLKNFVASHNDVVLIFQSFPLDGLCNSAVERKGDGKSCDLAKAVYCANEQGKGWQLHDWTFDNFGQADLSKMTEYAQSLGLNIDDWRKCRDSENAQNAILAQAKLGHASGIQGTPAVFVNGRLLPRGSFLPVLEAAYRELSGK